PGGPHGAIRSVVHVREYVVIAVPNALRTARSVGPLINSVAARVNDDAGPAVEIIRISRRLIGCSKNPWLQLGVSNRVVSPGSGSSGIAHRASSPHLICWS